MTQLLNLRSILIPTLVRGSLLCREGLGEGARVWLCSLIPLSSQSHILQL